MAEVDSDDLSPTLAFSILFLILITLALIRYVFLVFIIWSAAIGAGLGYLLMIKFEKIPNLLLLLQITGSVKTPLPANAVTKRKVKGCAVCGKADCARHKPEMSSQVMHPWENLKIYEPVDKALTEFLEITLETHLYSWYRDLSHNQGFLDEIRNHLRFLIASFIQRTMQASWSDFLLRKCLKKFMIHLDCFNRSKARASYGDDIQQLFFDKLKTYKHFATQNDVAESEYIRYTIASVLPLLLPPAELECKASKYFVEELATGVILKPLFEKLADPDFINNMLLILLGDDKLPEPKDPPSPEVELLDSFARRKAQHKISALNMSVYDLIHDALLLYPFMQFMKREGSLNVLQFCLAVEEFNQKSLAPELSDDEQVRIVDEAMELYTLYFEKDAVDKINFPDDVFRDFHEAVSSPKDAMTRLRTAAPLFKAYEFALNILELTFLPLFHQSEEFYHLICGERAPRKPLKEPELSNVKRKFMPLAELSKLANKIKAKKQQARDDKALALFMDGSENLSSAEMGNEACESESEDEYDTEVMSDEIRDLSYWHVTIPKVDHILEGNKKNYVFVMNVERIGGKADEEGDVKWTVVRRYNEFYVLDNKLRRFHDSLNEAELPPKRMILKKDYVYLNSVRLKLQEYLQRLVRSPVLRGSSLLHSFLTPGAEITGLFEPDSVGREAGRKIKNMKNKLMFERGQNLEPFLQAFLASAEPPAKKKIVTRVTPPSSFSGHRRSSSKMYLPPPSWARDHRRNISDSSRVQSSAPCGVTQYILYAARNIFKVPAWLHHVLVGLAFLGETTLNSYVDRFVSYKISLATHEKQLVNYIRLIRDVIYFDNDPPRTDTDKLQRRDDALHRLLTYCPQWVRNLIGPENYDASMRTLHEMLQHPKLNKQLLYILIDELVLELFPEIRPKSE